MKRAAYSSRPITPDVNTEKTVSRVYHDMSKNAIQPQGGILWGQGEHLPVEWQKQQISGKGAQTMDKNFDELFAKVSELQKLQEEREKLKGERLELENRARTFFDSVIERYRQEESRIDERMEEAERENEANKAAVVALTRQQLKAETAGEAFKDAERLGQLKAEVATYPQKVEALGQLKNEVCISSADQEIISGYRTEGADLGNRINRVSGEMQLLFADIQNRLILNCLATFEYIPGRAEFLPDQLKTLESMRKEETEE